MARVMVEICDEQVVEFLQEAVRTVMDGALPSRGDSRRVHILNIADASRHVDHLNGAIKYFGGRPVSWDEVIDATHQD